MLFHVGIRIKKAYMSEGDMHRARGSVLLPFYVKADNAIEAESMAMLMLTNFLEDIEKAFLCHSDISTSEKFRDIPKRATMYQFEYFSKFIAQLQVEITEVEMADDAELDDFILCELLDLEGGHHAL